MFVRNIVFYVLQSMLLFSLLYILLISLVYYNHSFLSSLFSSLLSFQDFETRSYSMVRLQCQTHCVDQAVLELKDSSCFSLLRGGIQALALKQSNVAFQELHSNSFCCFNPILSVHSSVEHWFCFHSTIHKNIVVIDEICHFGPARFIWQWLSP